MREFYEQRESSGSRTLGRVRIPRFYCYLNVFHVLRYVIDDSEKIGNYDFESLLFDKDLNQITILTNIPLRFEIFVEKFEVSLYCDEQPFNYRKSWWFGL